ncbi:hypothetical protein [Fischerella sp. PCC 9605]|uniref:hypothetical protein n=1 Tax=Fischerella sp. PCC 9605 TaxID=1173024 RepID=UPI0012DC7A89|nr:hypothetical protein [Fischerella sp. PCC 9605]
MIETNSFHETAITPYHPNPPNTPSPTTSPTERSHSAKLMSGAMCNVISADKLYFFYLICWGAIALSTSLL